MNDNSADQFLATLKKLREEGRHYIEASELAKLDMYIKQWPKDWGEDLQAPIYGDLEIQVEVELPDLGIRIKPEKEVPKEDKARFVFGAPYAYSAKVQVPSKDKEGVLDAISRLERFLAAWRITDWGGSAINYWCLFFREGGRVVSCLDSDKLNQIKRALIAIGRYTDRQQRLIWQAAWWLRQCETSIYNDQNPSVFREYVAYWNALECLTEAICDKWKPTKLTTKQKDAKIQEYVSNLGHPVTSKEIEKLYTEMVNPGLPQKVEHALNVCFGIVGSQYYAECFKKKPKESRLYQVRNDIAHGNIVEYNLETRLRMEVALSRLQVIVTNMLARLTEQALMLDTEVSSCYTCVNLLPDGICGLGLLPSSERFWRFVCDKYTHTNSPSLSKERRIKRVK